MLPILSVVNGVDLIRLRDLVLVAPVYAGIPGDYPWDRFEKAALQVGIPAPLADLGRSVFREAFQHDWPDELKVECGWLDGGQRMIYVALAFPELAEGRWRALLDSDGQSLEESQLEDLGPLELARALKSKGYQVGVVVP